MEKRVYPNEVLLGSVREILDEGRQVIIPTKGCSMLPFIVGEKDSVVLKKCDRVAVGDIVLAKLPSGPYVLHRVWSVDGDALVLMGDGNLRGREHCSVSDICGTVLTIMRKDGREVDCRSQRHQRAARIWRRLLPLRRLILAVYRRTDLKFY